MSYGPWGCDVYLIKTNINGDSVWARTFGGLFEDRAQSVQQTTDGGYIIAGYTGSYSSGNYDVLLIKTDANGDSVWARTYGGSGFDKGYSVQQTRDEGYIVAGYAGFGNNEYDGVLLKTDADGDSVWTHIIDRGYRDYPYSVQQTRDGGYIVNGSIQFIDGGDEDIFLIRFGEPAPLTITLTPHNPPVLIPSGGGTFVFDAYVENIISNPINYDAWTEVVLPNGNTHGPLVLRTGLTIPAGTTITREITQ